MDWFQLAWTVAGFIGFFALGHLLTKKEYEYDYRKNTEKQFETLDGLKKWHELKAKGRKNDADKVSKLPE